MKAAQTVFLLLMFSAVSLSPCHALAFGESEDQLFREDLHEARARAKDFHAQKLREATEDLNRQKAAVEAKRERAASEAEQEKLRRDFIKERNARPSAWLEQARLERSYDERKLAEDKEMDRSRRSYKQKRARVRKLIDTEAHIDENQEYGL